jgi:hypothetical protein
METQRRCMKMKTTISTLPRKFTRPLSITLAILLIMTAVILPNTGMGGGNGDVAYAAEVPHVNQRNTIQYNQVRTNKTLSGFGAF